MASVAARALQSAVAQLDDGVDIEGPIDCVCDSASACLSHIIQCGSCVLDNAYVSLFTPIMGELQYVCISPYRADRVLSYGPTKLVHAALKEEMERASPEIQDYAVNCIFRVRVMLPLYCTPIHIFFIF